MLKKIGQAVAKAFGYRIVNDQKMRDLESRLTEAEGSKNALRELKPKWERAERRYHDALAQIAQLQKQYLPVSRDAADNGQTTSKGERPLELDAEANVLRGRQLWEEGKEQESLHYYARALSLIHKYGPARQDLETVSKHFFEIGLTSFNDGNNCEAKRYFVKAVELDPTNAAARDSLEQVLASQQRWDLTKQCYVYHNKERGEQVYRETFLRALEYVVVAGITGEVLEFGTLGGYTARIISETMRELLILKQLHLFDSFEGLPEYVSPVDAQSYEIAGRNIWSDRMRFPDSLIQELEAPIDVHVFSSLSEVISPERIFIHRGFFEETLRKPLPIKAALIHIDCDLYQSTKEVLSRLYEKGTLQDGCVILFDDYNCFKASPYAGERLAFREFLDNQERFEASPFFTYGFNGAAFFLHEKQVAAQTRAA